MNEEQSLNFSLGFTLEPSLLKINKGSIYLNTINDMEYQLIEFIDPNQSLFRDLRTNKNILMSTHEFRNIKSLDSVKIDYDLISDHAWKKAQFKYEAIQPILTLSSRYIGSKGLEKRAKECNVSSRTLRNWVQLFKTANSIIGLLERKRGWSAGKTRLTSESDHLIKEVVTMFLLGAKDYSVEDVIRAVYIKTDILKLKRPSKTAIRLRFTQMKNKNLAVGSVKLGKNKRKYKNITSNKETEALQSTNFYKDIQ